MSWRYHHGPTTSRKSPRQPTAAMNGSAGRRPARQALHAVDDEHQPDRATQQVGVVPRDRRQADEEARPRRRRGRRLGDRAPRATGRRDERLEDREVLGLGHEHDARRPGSRRARRRRAGRSCDAPTSRAIAQVSGAASEPMRTIGSAEAIAVGPSSDDERRLDERRERQPVGIRGDGQHGIRRAAGRRPRRRSRRSRRSGRGRPRARARRPRNRRNPGSPGPGT